MLSTMRSLNVALILSAFWCVCRADHTFHPLASDLKTFLGNKSGTLVYTSDIDGDGIYFITIDGSALQSKYICDGAAPKISPDGTRILYTSGSNPRVLYIRSLIENSPDSDRRRIADGTHNNRHYWWIHPVTGDEYIVYCKQNDGIYCQKLTSESRPDGAATRLFTNWTANAGRSGDGRFLAGSGLDVIDNTIYRGIFEISPSDAVQSATQQAFVEFAGDIAGGVMGGFCYGYMSPAKPTDPFYGCMAHLCGGHFAIYIRKFDAAKPLDSSIVVGLNAPNFANMAFDTIPRFGDGYIYQNWEMPVWSTHPEYITAYGAGKKKVGSSTIYADHAFVFNLTSGEYLRITRDTNDVFFSHLWINTSASSDPPVLAVIQADPSRGTAPLAVSFDGSSSTGRGLSYSWTYGDGHTGTGAEVSHSYVTPGTYTARLIVMSGATSDTATTEIIVDARPAVAAKVELTPAGPRRIIKGTSLTFVAEVFDEDDQQMPDAAVTWSVRGNGGGTVDTAGRYRAGATPGRTDTVIATSGSVQGRCVLNIVDDPMRLLSSHGGATYTVGDTVTIRYETDTFFVTRLSIGFTPDEGSTILHISNPGASLDYGEPGWGTFRWVIPAKIYDVNLLDSVSTVTTSGRFVLMDYGKTYPDQMMADAFTIQAGQSVAGGLASRLESLRIGLTPVRVGYILRLGAEGPYSVTVFDAKGSVRASLVAGERRSIVLPTADFAPGCYVVRVKNARETWVRRIPIGAP